MAVYRTVQLALYCDTCLKMIAHLSGPEDQLTVMARTQSTCRDCILAPLRLD